MSEKKIALIQERIAELYSGIINIFDDKIEIRGFLSPERLYDYLDGTDCFYSFGIYPKELYDESISKDDAHFIVRENNVETKHWQYEKIYESCMMINVNGNLTKRVLKVRKDRYGNNYQFIAKEENRIFESLEEMDQYLFERYDLKLPL